MNYGSLRQDARRLSDQGRYGDSMMMHVNPIEVAALDSITPGGLPRNPATGQPEAFPWLPLIGMAIGMTAGGATAKKRDQSLMEGILMGGGLGLVGGMSAGALAGGAGAAGAGAAGTAAASSAPAAGVASAAPGVYSTVASPLASVLQGGQAVGTGSVLAPATAAQSAAPAFTGLHGAAGTPGLGVLNPEALAAAQASTPMSVKASNLASINLANAANAPVTPGSVGRGIGELAQGRGGEAFMEGGKETLSGYGEGIDKAMQWAGDNPMLVMGGAMGLDALMAEDDEEEYGDYKGQLAYADWTHGGPR